MSVSYIPDWVKYCLWGQSGGRCQYAGCNQPLYRDGLTKTEFNSAYIAHIVADKETGPRGDPVLSAKLKSDLSNLMLLCDVHHRLVDKVDVPGHRVSLLRDMKRRHEDRIERLAGIAERMRSHVLLYGARIGEHHAQLNLGMAAEAMVPDHYPATSRAIELGLKNSSFVDGDSSYWTIEAEHLRRQFASQVTPLLSLGDIEHLSVFGLAPIPLLIQLGRLLSDIPATDVFQLHREPPDWKWQPEPESFEYTVARSCSNGVKTVALVLALSADITADRIHSAIGKDCSIWNVSHANPGNDFLQSRNQLAAFRQAMRDVFNDIKTTHGEDAKLHVFPAVPVSVAIETGRVWMPKADLPFWVYDQNRSTGGFAQALFISQSG